MNLFVHREHGKDEYYETNRSVRCLKTTIVPYLFQKILRKIDRILRIGFYIEISQKYVETG